MHDVAKKGKNNNVEKADDRSSYNYTWASSALASSSGQRGDPPGGGTWGIFTRCKSILFVGWANMLACGVEMSS